MDRIFSTSCLLLSLAVAPCRGDERDRRDDEVSVTVEVQRAIESGHEFLRRSQHESGAFGHDTDYPIAITAFSCLSLLAGGHVPGRGVYGGIIEKGILYLLAQQSRTGYFKRKDDKSRMHGHGYVTLVLAQAYGMTDRNSEEIRQALHLAIDLSEKAQTKEGGWGYEPGDSVHEGSVTVGQLQALRAARNVGMVVSIETIEKAREYLRLSANPDGSFKYRLDHPGTRSSFPLTAAGVASLQARGDYAAIELQRGLDFMIRYLPPNGTIDRYYSNFYYYGQFYGAQAMYHASDRNYWKRWYPAMSRQLLDSYYRRDSMGSGHFYRSRYGDIYATAIATLILQIPYKYLPIFQR